MNLNLDHVWRLFGSLYRATMKVAAEQSNMEIQNACIELVKQLRERSGLDRTKSLRLVVVLRDALNQVIEIEKRT